MMKFNVSKHIEGTTKDEWLEDVIVNNLEELKAAVNRLYDEHKVEVEVDFRSEMIFIGWQSWMNLG